MKEKRLLPIQRMPRMEKQGQNMEHIIQLTMGETHTIVYL